MKKTILMSDQRLKKLLPAQKAKPGTEYIPSVYAVPFSHRERHYVFNTVTNECIEAELPSACTAGDGHDELIEGYYLVPRDKDECAFYLNLLAVMKACFPYDGPSVYTVLPTFACNARCPYCYEEGAASLSMTAEAADQTLRYILKTRSAGKSVCIRWFGGEPLLGVRMIDRISRGLRKEGVEYSSYMISNGSLITREIVEKMKDVWNLTSIQISMDGAEEDYLRRKRYPVYHDEYRKVMEAVSMMSEVGIDVTVRCNVDEENWPRIPRFLNDMRDGVRDKRHVALYFAPLYDVRFGENGTAIWEKILSVDPLIEEAGFLRYPFKIPRLEFQTQFCISDRGCSVIHPDGSLYPCEHYPITHRFGDIWNGVTDADARMEFCSMDKVREKCRKCPFLPSCTPFAHCPLDEKNCRTVMELHLEHLLRDVMEGNDRKGFRTDQC